MENFKFKKLDNLIGNIIKERSEEAIRIRQVRQAAPLFDVSPTNVDFGVNDDGIFVKKEKHLYRSYLYLPRYYTKEHGKLPSKHLFVCPTVKKYSNFKLTNEERVKVFCRDAGEYVKNESAPLNIPLKEENLLHQLDYCSDCKNIFMEKLGKSLFKKPMHEVILDFEENDSTKNRAIGIEGYVTNWDEISTGYRTSRNYTCENCNLKIVDIEDRQFIHTHHINYDKTNNKRDNLQCLCIECHSKVDKIHEKNFSTPYQQRLIKEFREKYRK